MMRPAKVLVVDDEAIVCASCRRILSNDGYDVSVAFSGREALDKVRNERFDVIIMDLKMPGPGGLAVLRNIKRDHPRVEVVIITGYPTIESAKESIRLGALDFLLKPFDPDRITALVNKAVECKQWTIQRR